MHSLQFKTCDIIKDVDAKSGVVQAYFSAFGNKDSHGDIIAPGAFKDSIQKFGPAGSNRIKVLWQHEYWNPIGVPTKLNEDKKGLFAEFKISKTQIGKDALTLYEDGVINEHSIGFSDTQRSDEDESIITGLRLWEGSPVTWGANALTPTVSVRSGLDHAAMLVKARAALDQMEAALKSTISDDLGYSLEYQVRYLKALLTEGEEPETVSAEAVREAFASAGDGLLAKSVANALFSPVRTLMNQTIQ